MSGHVALWPWGHTVIYTTCRGAVSALDLSPGITVGQSRTRSAPGARGQTPPLLGLNHQETATEGQGAFKEAAMAPGTLPCLCSAAVAAVL